MVEKLQNFADKVNESVDKHNSLFEDDQIGESSLQKVNGLRNSEAISEIVVQNLNLRRNYAIDELNEVFFLPFTARLYKPLMTLKDGPNDEAEEVHIASSLGQVA